MRVKDAGCSEPQEFLMSGTEENHASQGFSILDDRRGQKSSRIYGVVVPEHLQPRESPILDGAQEHLMFLTKRAPLQTTPLQESPPILDCHRGLTSSRFKPWWRIVFVIVKNLQILERIQESRTRKEDSWCLCGTQGRMSLMTRRIFHMVAGCIETRWRFLS